MTEFSVEEEINQILINRPHVVILGAGASRAACPSGDKNGKVQGTFSDQGTGSGCFLQSKHPGDSHTPRPERLGQEPAGWECRGGL